MDFGGKMKPRYSTLVRHLALMIGEVEFELEQLDEDELKQAPFVSKTRACIKAREVLRRARGY